MITGVFFILIILKQLLWTTLIPVWQFPDEQAHFAQVQDIAEGQGILVNAPLSTSKEIAVSEELLGTRRDGFGNNKFTYHPEYNIRYTSGTVGLYESEIKSLPSKYRKELTIKEATAYPPLYYQIESIGYWLVYNGDLIMRIFAVRLINLLFYLFTAVIVLASAKLIFPVSRIKQLTLAVFVMFQPMYSFVFAGVNSDNLYNMLATGVVYLCLNLLLRDWNIKTVTAAVIMVIIGKFIKPQTNLLYLFYIYPLAVQFIFHKNFVKAFLFMILVLLVSFGIIIINIINGSQLLPELLPLSYILHTHINTFVNFFINSIIHIYREIMPWYWGIYRWLSLTYPRPVHRIINWITLFSVIGLIRYLFVMFRKDKGGIFKRPVLFSIYAIAVYSFGLISYNFLFTVSHRFQLGLQGRYFFPVVFPLSTLMIIGIDSLVAHAKWENFILKLSAVGMVLFHFYALFFVTLSYYPAKSVAGFFQYTSQYKPDFFKSPFTEVLLAITAFVFLLFLYQFITKPEKQTIKNNNTRSR